MKLHDLRPDKGATKKRTRVGRGISAGKGKTAGRGTKGQGARAGGGKGAYFEGGQLPLVRRLPFRRGFTNHFRIPYQEVNVDQLEERFRKGSTVTPEKLAEAGLIRDAEQPVVVLGRGELTKNFKISAHRFTKGSLEKIEAAGGSTELLEVELVGAHATIKKLRKEQLEAMRASKSK